MSVKAERSNRVIDSESLDFLANVMPALGITESQISAATPAGIAASMEALAAKTEVLAKTYEAPDDRRLALFSAVLLRAASPERQAIDLGQELKVAGYEFTDWQLPIITREAANWLCDQFVEPEGSIDGTQLAQVIQLPVFTPVPEARPDVRQSGPIERKPEPLTETSASEVSVVIGAENAPSPETLTDEVPLDSDEDLQKLLDQLEREARNDVNVDALRQYMREIGKQPLLRAEQEVELAQSIEAGIFAQEALDKAEAQGVILLAQHRRDLRQLAREGARSKGTLIEANLRLVVSLARRYQGRGLELLDLIQEGNLGLIRTVEKFDYQKGYKFSTYATWWIRQAITRGIDDRGHAIRLPVYAVEEYQRFTRAGRELQQALGRDPSLTEVAQEIGMKEERLVELVRARRYVLSLDAKAPGHDDGSTLGELVEDDGWLLEIHDAEGDDPVVDTARRIIPNVLTPQEYGIIKARYLSAGRVMTLEELGQRFGITHEAIRQRELRALAKLLHPSVSLGSDEGIKLLGGKPETWRLDAECYEANNALFFEQTRRGASHPTYRLCGNCAVRASCLQFANDRHIKFGVWGGLNTRQRDMQNPAKS